MKLLYVLCFVSCFSIEAMDYVAFFPTGSAEFQWNDFQNDFPGILPHLRPPTATEIKNLEDFFVLINENLNTKPDQTFFNRLCDFKREKMVDFYARDKKDGKSAFLKAAENGNIVMLRKLIINARHLTNTSINNTLKVLSILPESQLGNEYFLIAKHVINHICQKNWDKDSLDQLKTFCNSQSFIDKYWKQQFKGFLLNKNLPPLLKYLAQQHLEPLQDNQPERKMVSALPQDIIKIIVSFVIAQTLCKQSHTIRTKP